MDLIPYADGNSPVPIFPVAFVFLETWQNIGPIAVGHLCFVQADDVKFLHLFLNSLEAPSAVYFSVPPFFRSSLFTRSSTRSTSWIM